MDLRLSVDFLLKSGGFLYLGEAELTEDGCHGCCHEVTSVYQKKENWWCAGKCLRTTSPEKKNPWFATLVNVHSVNIPTMVKAMSLNVELGRIVQSAIPKTLWVS